MLLALGLTAAAVVGGTLATYLYDRRMPFHWRLPIGACTGLAALGLIGFVLASKLGLNQLVLVITCAAVAAPSAMLIAESNRHVLWADLQSALRTSWLTVSSARRQTIVRAVLYAAGAFLLWRVTDRAMFVRSDGIYTGVSHNIGDLPFHLSAINRFVYGQNFPPEHPSFAGVSFSYPFLTDFIGAMFVQTGLPVREVIVWSTLLLCLILAALLYRWTMNLTGNREAAFLAPALVLLNGGLGWWLLVGESARHGEGLLGLLARLPHDYTIGPGPEWRWGNVVTTMLITQRGLLLGLPLAIIVFDQWWAAMTATEDDARTRRLRMIGAGVIAGLLPLIHAHSYAVVIGMAMCLTLLTGRWRTWTPFLAVSLGVGLPQIWWLAHGSAVQSGKFIDWSFGWDRGDQNVFLFWLKNTGLLIPIVVAAMLWRGSWPLLSRLLLIFYLPFTLCFIIPNALRLAPWIWDNMKVLVYWHVASVPLVALLLARLARVGPWRAALAGVLFVSLTLAGGLDLWRVASNAVEYRIFDTQGIRFAGVLMQKTSPTSLILHAPVHNHPVVLTGRRSLMGYPGHLWSHGLEYGPREADIKRMYAGAPEAEALLARYGIQYVVVGPPERALMPTNERFFRRFPRIGEAGGYRLYGITNLEE